MATILYFGWARDCSGCSSEEIDLHDISSVDGLWNRLIDQHPRLVDCRRVSRITANMEYLNEDDVVTADAEYAIIPPVAGG